MQAAQQSAEAIAAVLRSPVIAAWGPALTAADILYKRYPADMGAAITAFAQDLGNKLTVRGLFPHTARRGLYLGAPSAPAYEVHFLAAFSMPAAKPGVIFYPLPVQARLGCAALLMHAAGFSQKPLQLFAEVLKVSLFPSS